MRYNTVFAALIIIVVAIVACMIIRPSGFIAMIFGGMKPAHSGIQGLYHCFTIRSPLNKDVVLKSVSSGDVLICGADTVRVTFELQWDSVTHQTLISNLTIKGKAIQQTDLAKRKTDEYCKCFLKKLSSN